MFVTFRTSRRVIVSGLLLAGGLMGCAANAPQIPVNADPESMSRLTGLWEGEFKSVETGRNGTITFDLDAARDTASGEVTMLTRPGEMRHPTPSDPSGVQQQPLARTLFITFVQAENDLVTGQLNPYEDPDCGCILITVFEGRLEDDRIEGTYTSRSQATGLFVKGTWYVQRRKL